MVLHSLALCLIQQPHIVERIIIAYCMHLPEG